MTKKIERKTQRKSCIVVAWSNLFKFTLGAEILNEISRISSGKDFWQRRNPTRNFNSLAFVAFTGLGHGNYWNGILQKRGYVQRQIEDIIVVRERILGKDAHDYLCFRYFWPYWYVYDIGMYKVGGLSSKGLIVRRTVKIWKYFKLTRE